MATKTPEEVFDSASPQVKRLLNDVLKIEKEFQHYKNLASLRDKNKELCARIVKLIEQEVGR